MLETFQFVEAEIPWFFPVLVFVFGAAVGSFLNVCIYRIPAGRSVVLPGSTCACGKPIPFFHNIPVLSWILLRGRAACCGSRFSVRYPAVELLVACLFLVSWLAFDSPAKAVIGMLFIAFLVCATFIDLDHMIIPDRFSIGGMVLGVVLSSCFPVLHGIEGLAGARNVHAGLLAVSGALVGAGLVYWVATLGEIVFRKPAMGEGDVKFVGFIGAFCGWQGAVFSLFGGAVIGSVVLVPVLLLQRLFGKGNGAAAGPVPAEGEDSGEEDLPLTSQVPFGPMLAVAGLVYFLGFDRFVDAYFAEFASLFLVP